jgi:hypothetical protein
MTETTPWDALADRLPLLVEAQFAAYRRLAHADNGAADGPREIIAWENARKAALAHLQALIRVYDLVHARLGASVPDTAAGAAGDGLALLLSEVRRELDAHPDDDPDFGE